MSEEVLKGGHVVPHYFESAEQAETASKLGLWLFLVTEILLFGGLFVAYIVNRSLHPGMFHEASQHLDKTLGAFNTVVLICSSFSMAMAVQMTRENKRGKATVLLLFTLLCAGIFMGVKYIEYSHKFHAGIAPLFENDQGGLSFGFSHFNYSGFEHKDANIFYSLYFVMTGIHGIHVLVGMGLISWVLIKNMKGRFSDEYYTPVDLTGLYWHLVDLIWIYLFPLIYLIG